MTFVWGFSFSLSVDGWFACLHKENVKEMDGSMVTIMGIDNGIDENALSLIREGGKAINERLGNLTTKPPPFLLVVKGAMIDIRSEDR